MAEILLVLAERERADREAVLMRGCVEVRDGGVDGELEGTVARGDRLDDLHRVVLVRELAALAALVVLRLQRPVEAVVLDLIVRALVTEERPQVAPAFEVGRRRHVRRHARRIPGIRETEVREPGAARRELGLEAVAGDVASVARRGLPRRLLLAAERIDRVRYEVGS